MKRLSIISLLCCGMTTYAQTTPAPPYYPAPSPVYNVPQNGTPMVKNVVENNNPSVQASIPILNKPSSLETDLGGYVAQNTRIVYDNVQQNTPAKNMATDGTANVPTAVAATSVSSDTIMRSSVPVAEANAGTVVKTTVIYNNTTGTDVSKTTDKTTLITTKTGNSAPVMQTYISENVVNRFKSLYGETLYDIRQVRYGNNATIYIIRIMKGGAFTTMYLDENGELVVH